MPFPLVLQTFPRPDEGRGRSKVDGRSKTLRRSTIHTKMITNKNLEICFRIRFCNGKANEFPQIFFRIRFRNDYVGHAQATTVGHAYEIN